jgi:hypothetical protein
VNDLKENVNDSNQSGQSVFDRLLQYASKLNEKKQLQAELSNRPIDQNTGREFFRPLTGRKPQIDVSNIFSMPPWLHTMVVNACCGQLEGFT